MSWWLLPLALIWVAVVVFLRVYRIWFVFYIVATIGCAYGLTVIARDGLDLDVVLGQSIAWSVHQIAGLLHMPTRIFASAPASLLVMVVSQQVGWTLLKVGVESSGLLEMIVLISLLLFYPGQLLSRRIWQIVIGCSLTWVANVVRVLLIISILQLFGKESLVVAHSLVGKGIFFVLTIAIYWYLLTGPTMQLLGHSPKTPSTT